MPPCKFLLSSASTCDSEEIVSSTSFGCPGGPQQNDSDECRVFPASNILSLDVDQWSLSYTDPANYWLAENRQTGEEQGFIMYLGCIKTVVGVSLRNTHNADYHDRSTKKLRILGSVTNDGPWQELLIKDLEDSRHQKPPPLQRRRITNSAVVSFIKFELLEFYGYGGGLQYFAATGEFW